MREFAFELRLCAHLERRDGIVARQLGAGVGRAAGRRVIDAVVVEPGPALEERVALTPDAVPAAAIDADASVAEWRPVTEVFDGPPARARARAEAAVEAGFFERSRRGGRDVVRQAARYPRRWFGELVGIENKPDLGTPGALQRQLRTDVSLGLLDRVVVATESHVTGAHRNRLPDEVGLWRVAFDADDPVTVLREPAALPTDEPGVQLLDRRPDRAEIQVASAGEKARARRRLAERAYGKGWRVAMPPCAHAAASTTAGTPALPHCAWKGRVVDPGRECGPDCGGHEPADPPAVDATGERERRQGWVADPEGRTRRQAHLDRF